MDGQLLSGIIGAAGAIAGSIVGGVTTYRLDKGLAAQSRRLAHEEALEQQARLHESALALEAERQQRTFATQVDLELWRREETLARIHSLLIVDCDTQLDTLRLAVDRFLPMYLMRNSSMVWQSSLRAEVTDRVRLVSSPTASYDAFLGELIHSRIFDSVRSHWKWVAALNVSAASLREDLDAKGSVDGFELLAYTRDCFRALDSAVSTFGDLGRELDRAHAAGHAHPPGDREVEPARKTYELRARQCEMLVAMREYDIEKLQEAERLVAAGRDRELPPAMRSNRAWRSLLKAALARDAERYVL